MKKTYTAPEIEIRCFMTEDIITTSGGSTIDPPADDGEMQIYYNRNVTPIIDWSRDIETIL